MTAADVAIKVSIVVAATRNGVIGRGDVMPWRMPSSLKRFRSLTLGKPMIMGRKTFASIGKALDGRDTIVITRNDGFSAAGVVRAANLGEALRTAQRLAAVRAVNEIIIAGGGEIYAQALPYATHVYLDLIDATLDGDAVFPSLPQAAWQEISRQPLLPSPRDEYPAEAVNFERIGAPAPWPAA